MADKVDILVISRAEVESVISPSEAVDTVETVWREMAAGNVTEAGRDQLKVDPSFPDNDFISPRASIRSTGALGIKWANRFPKRPPGISLLYGIVVLNDMETGKPIAVVEGQSITRIRTGANSAFAGKRLAKSDSRVMAIIGCGEEARTHLTCFNSIFDLETVRVYDILPESLSSFKKEMQEQVSVEIVLAVSPQEAVAEADIVCMVTSAHETVVLESWIPKGCFVTGVGQFRDLDIKLAKKADKFVLGYTRMDRPVLYGMAEKNAELIPPESIYGDMLEIVSGKKAGRESDRERILYVHTGVGSLDVATAHMVYTRATERGLGTRVSLL